MRRIAACLDLRHEAARRFISGIIRFASRHGDWSVHVCGNYPSEDIFAKADFWRPEGIIIDSLCHLREHAAILKCPSVRAIAFVNTDIPRRILRRHVQVLTDDKAITDAAFGLFKQHGLENFAFVNSTDTLTWNAARLRAFKRTVRENGYTLQIYNPEPDAPIRNWATEQRRLIDWLCHLPKPCGVLAVYDQRAKHILDACQKAHIKVPEQIQVLGIDNEPYICEYTTPQLSSIALDMKDAGFRAAQALAKALDSLTSRTRVIRIKSLSVVERESTSDLNREGARVQRVLRFIRENHMRKITVSDVARQVGGGVRLLEKNFKAVLGSSVRQCIIEARLAKAKELLESTPTPIDSIASMCGFNTNGSLKAIFKKRFQVSMRTYRKNARLIS